MEASYAVGMQFRLTKDALENYGEKYNGIYNVRAIFDHYAPINSGDSTGHPGFDESLDSPLYEADGLPFALYEWEMQGW